MTVSVFTGKPGNGKTALIVSELMDVKDRPIFCMGIKELKVPHNPVPPLAEWTEKRPSPEDPSLLLDYYTFPPNSLVVIDEAQTVFRARSSGSKVPAHVAALETHRHTGIDIWLITQGPGLLDGNVKNLVGRHVHIRTTALGRYKYEWAEMGEPENKTSRANARQDRYKPPKRAFPMYKSAELHTKTSIRLPWYVYIFVLAVLALAGSAWYASHRIAAKQKPQDLSILGAGPSSPHADGVGGGQHPSLAQYTAATVPRLQGVPYSAPQYDGVTVPTVAPIPAACYAVTVGKTTSCRCMTQQGTRYDTSPEICASIVKNGFFNSWAAPGQQSPQAASIQAAPNLTGGQDFPPSRRPRLVDAETLHNG